MLRAFGEWCVSTTSRCVTSSPVTTSSSTCSSSAAVPFTGLDGLELERALRSSSQEVVRMLTQAAARRGALPSTFDGQADDNAGAKTATAAAQPSRDEEQQPSPSHRGAADTETERKLAVLSAAPSPGAGGTIPSPITPTAPPRLLLVGSASGDDARAVTGVAGAAAARGGPLEDVSRASAALREEAVAMVLTQQPSEPFAAALPPAGSSSGSAAAERSLPPPHEQWRQQTATSGAASLELAAGVAAALAAMQGDVFWLEQWVAASLVPSGGMALQEWPKRTEFPAAGSGEMPPFGGVDDDKGGRVFLSCPRLLGMMNNGIVALRPANSESVSPSVLPSRRGLLHPGGCGGHSQRPSRHV